MGKLAGAGGLAEVGGGAAYVVDVSLELWVSSEQLGFFQQTFVAAALDDAPLVEGQAAEGAFAEAPAVAGQTELDLPDGGHAAVLVAKALSTSLHLEYYKVRLL